jgi:hypothetical protein
MLPFAQPKHERKIMSVTLIVLAVIGVIIVAGIVMMIPELRRYFRIRKM